MGHVLDAALVVAHQQVGVMILAVRDPGERVHERHRLVVVRERVHLDQLALVDGPALHLLQHIFRLLRSVGRDVAFTRLAFPGRQFAHQGLLSSASRAMRIAAGGCES